MRANFEHGSDLVDGGVAGSDGNARPEQLGADSGDGDPADGQCLGSECLRKDLQHLPVRWSGPDLRGGGGMSVPRLRLRRRHPLKASDSGRPHAVLCEAAGRARRALEDRVSGTDGSGDYDTGIQAAQPQLAADSGVHEPQRVLAESGGELGAAQVWLIGDLQNCRPDRQPGAWRQVSAAQVEIGVELITG